MRWRVVSLIPTLFAVFAEAATNRTIDDTHGDSITGNKPVYQPLSAWAGPSCVGCAILPDTTQCFEGTYSAATYNPGLGSMNITMDFPGTAIYVYFILANFQGDGITTETAVNFSVDGNLLGAYTHTPTSSPNIDFDVPVFSYNQLSNSTHTLLISTEGPKNIYVNFDYAIYTFEDPPPVTVPATSLAPATSPATSPTPQSTNPPPTTSSPTSPPSSPTSPSPPSSANPTVPSSSTQSNSVSSPTIVASSLSRGAISVTPLSSGSITFTSTTNSAALSASSTDTVLIPTGQHSHGALIGGVVGGAVGAVVLIALLALLRRRRRKRALDDLPVEAAADPLNPYLDEPLAPPRMVNASGSAAATSIYASDNGSRQDMSEQPFSPYGTQLASNYQRSELSSGPASSATPSVAPLIRPLPSTAGLESSRDSKSELRRRELQRQSENARVELEQLNNRAQTSSASENAELQQHIRNLQAEILTLRAQQLHESEAAPPEYSVA